MEEIVSQLQNYVLETGAWGPLVYLLTMIVAIIISPIPSSPLAIFAGAVFGWLPAMILSLMGATIGAIIAFYIARHFGRPLVLKLVSPKKIVDIEKLMPEQKLTWAVFLLRIPPLPFFDAVSYAAGLTKISFKNFTIATFFGLIPLIFVLSYFGEIVNNLTYLIVAVIVIAIFVFLSYKFFHRKH